MFRKRRSYSLYRTRTRASRRVAGFLAFVAAFFVVYTLVTGFLIRTYRIGSVSMEPALSVGDRIIATPLAFGAMVPFTSLQVRPVRAPRRGDIVVVQVPHAEIKPIVRALQPVVSVFTGERARLADEAETEWDDELMVKRVIGIPGDTLFLEGFTAYIRPAGWEDFVSELDIIRADYTITFSPLPDNWSPDLLPASGRVGRITLGPSEYFLMGDHRSASSDSRTWGPVSADNLRALALLKYWPLRRADSM